MHHSHIYKWALGVERVSALSEKVVEIAQTTEANTQNQEGGYPFGPVSTHLDLHSWRLSVQDAT